VRGVKVSSLKFVITELWFICIEIKIFVINIECR
jgi:hypothetical protein